jgi:hypothetical protein
MLFHSHRAHHEHIGPFRWQCFWTVGLRVGCSQSVPRWEHVKREYLPAWWLPQTGQTHPRAQGQQSCNTNRSINKTRISISIVIHNLASGRSAETTSQKCSIPIKKVQLKCDAFSEKRSSLHNKFYGIVFIGELMAHQGVIAHQN